MADQDQSALIANFVAVTGVDAERARFYLESSAWNLGMATSSFFDNQDGNDSDDNSPAVPEQEREPAAAAEPAAVKRPAEKSRFGTLAALAKESDSDEEEGQAFYAGGTEHGAGQQILGPPRKKKDPNALVEDMFKAAKDHGAEVVDSDPSPRQRAPVFRGTGYRLGDTEAGPSVVASREPVHAEARQVDMVLKMWQDGFSVDNGPLRGYQDAENREFLESIKKGEVPRELLKIARGGEVNLNMEDHRNEDYVKPKVIVKAFSGEGHRLGSVAATVVGETRPSSEVEAKQNEDVAKTEVVVDQSQPATNLQIRLSDGSRMVARFNHSHTVGDVRRYIVTARPQFTDVNFTLMTTFPNKELSDNNVTLKDGNLLNAVLVQRVK